MKVKVTKDLTIVYKGKKYGRGQEFEVAKKDLSDMDGLVEVPEEEEVLEAETPDEEDLPDEDLTERLTVSEIKMHLDEKGIGYDDKAKKAELLALLKE